MNGEEPPSSPLPRERIDIHRLTGRSSPSVHPANLMHARRYVIMEAVASSWTMERTDGTFDT